MATSSSEKKTAAHRFIRPFSGAVMVVAVLASAQADSLVDDIRTHAVAGRPGGYVFVSERVGETALIPLARDARRAGLTLVINGFWGDLAETQKRIARINDTCCGQNGPHWQVNPLLFQRYEVKQVPSFVVIVGAGTAAHEFSKVSGEMSVANALKTFAQHSTVPEVRRFAGLSYTKAFATQ